MKRWLSCACVLGAGVVWAADFDIRDYGAKPGDTECQTAAIQKAIDAAAQAGGGRVVVPKGTWMTGTITLKSHVHLHLERNGILLGSPNCADYPERPAESLRHVVSEMLPRYRNACMIWADEAEDIAITGPGIIDCNGTRFVELKEGAENYTWGWAYRRIPGLPTPPRVVFFAGCRKVRLADHCMRNQPSGWSYWITDCDDVVCANLKIKADVKYPNNDGLHINSSRNVKITGCDISCGDDAIVLRACNSALRRTDNPPCANVTIEKCRLRSYSSALRIGWIHDGVITNCVMRDTTIYDSTVGIGIALPMRYGDIRNGRMSDEGREATFIKDILFENVTMDTIYAHPLRLMIDWNEEVKCAGIHNLTFRNVKARSLEMPFIQGRDRGVVSDFLFENCRFTTCADGEFPMSYLEHGASAWNRMKTGAYYGFRNFRYVNTVFDGEPRGDYAYRFAPATNVTVTGGFWLPRLETNRLVTLTTDFTKCEEARIPNFEKAARREAGTFKGIPYDDSDVYKVIEGASYILAQKYDAKLDAYLDGLITKIAGAQEADGYLYTARTLGHDLFNRAKTDDGTVTMMGKTRWTNTATGHELYNLGHLYEAAVAHYDATGKTNLLAVACKSADLVCRTFGAGPGQIRAVPGHEEIELALLKLYRATGERRYFDQARYFLAQRGHATGTPGDTPLAVYAQAHAPVTMQTNAVGHAVRAGYLYSAMADMFALSRDPTYEDALQTLWKDLVGSKMYLTGGIGSRHEGEAFGEPYELPNETAYNETCAAIANALFNERMFRLTGEGQYMDVVETILYNGFLSGVSLSGDEFFYPNPLASRKGYKRSKWFGTSCCPVNVVRFLPQIASFAFATQKDNLYLNLYMDATAKLKLPDGNVKVVEKTDYPWSGKVAVTVEPEKEGQTFELRLRVPRWLSDRPLSGDLYWHTGWKTLAFTLKVNGETVKANPWRGYAQVKRAWKKGDLVEIEFPLETRRVQCDNRRNVNRDLAAVMRGPVVFCAEGADNPDATLVGEKKNEAGASLPLAATFEVGETRIGDQLVPQLKASNGLRLVPYSVWGNRGDNDMCVWFKLGK